ncbi:helix-turn-helix domain-containing protein [Arachidicoccus terrestris]|uniref:helix-turn-helix domain-containing protein n=1 Tax=Arachidicoccus terrestris TaxID=2875539 RepID=UPI001CC4B165|nr:AraC family transcriptional regulator [Arachidicoccus terrestris]UAY56022.1 AraC family transcriptional regulator [Arachidicoccus terrestris]
MRKNDYNTNPPYVICFSERPKATKNVKGRLPSWCRVPVPKAEEAVYYQFPGVDILSQKLNRLHFSANAVEIHTGVPFELPFQVNEDQLFFLYMLEGGMEFSTADGLYITKAQKKNFYLSHNGPGMFKARMGAGKHVAFVVAIKVSWAKRNFQEFANLNPLLQEMLNATQPYNIMPHCRIDRQVEQWLAEAISTPHTNTVVQDSTFRMFISLTLDHYDTLLAASQGMIAYKVKQYIDEHYTDHDLKYNKLASLHYITVRTLNNKFKAAYHITIHDYCTLQRMKMAKQLLEKEGMLFSDVYFKVGYNNESSFRYAYNKFWKKAT